MYAAKPWHPELAMVDMRVLFQVNSASSYEQYWSAHRHIHSKIRNRLEPASTEKLVYVYSNSKMVAATSVADKLKIGIMKMTGRENEDDKQHGCSVTSRDPAVHSHARGSLPVEARVAKSPSRG